MKLWGRDGRCKPYTFLLLRHVTVPYGAVNAHERVLERRHRADFSMLVHPVAMEPMKGAQFKTASCAMRSTISSLLPQTTGTAGKEHARVLAGLARISSLSVLLCEAISCHGSCWVVESVRCALGKHGTELASAYILAYAMHRHFHLCSCGALRMWRDSGVPTRQAPRARMSRAGAAER